MGNSEFLAKTNEARKKSYESELLNHVSSRRHPRDIQGNIIECNKCRDLKYKINTAHRLPLRKAPISFPIIIDDRLDTSEVGPTNQRRTTLNRTR